jgi:hypothetical protein
MYIALHVKYPLFLSDFFQVRRPGSVSIVIIYKSLARSTSRCILFDGENISFDTSLVIYIYIYIVLIFIQL